MSQTRIDQERITGQDDAIAISALQHYSYCPRQCALIHQEQAFDDNHHTARGNAVHQLVDEPGSEGRPGAHIERALPVFCERLGLSGRADVVEFLADGTPYPIEYKHGPRRQRVHDDLQLAAQALCLEEMTGKAVPAGAIFHHTSRRRREVPIAPALRAQVEQITSEVRTMLQSGHMPPPVNDARCKQCSLIDLCQPEMIENRNRLRALRRTLFDPEG
jgi:CRISPR-associated exonuclease Cas4